MMKIVILLGFVALGSAWPQPHHQQARTCNFLEANPFFEAASSQRGITSQETHEELVFLTEFSRFMNKRLPSLLHEFAQSKRIFKTKQAMKSWDPLVVNLMQNHQLGQRASRALEEVDWQAMARSDDGSGSGSGDAEDTDDTTAAEEEEEEETSSEEDTAAEDDDASDDATAEEEEEEDDASDDSSSSSSSGAVDDVVDVVSAASDATAEVFVGAVEDTVDFVDAAVAAAEGLFQDVSDTIQDLMTPESWETVCPALWLPLQGTHCSSMRSLACAPSVMAAFRVCQKGNSRAHSLHKCIQTVMGEGFCNYSIADYLLM